MNLFPQQLFFPLQLCASPHSPPMVLFRPGPSSYPSFSSTFPPPPQQQPSPPQSSIPAQGSSSVLSPLSTECLDHTDLTPLQVPICVFGSDVARDPARYPPYVTFPPERIWRDLQHYCTSAAGGRCDCRDRKLNDKVICRPTDNLMSQLWHAAPLTRYCESLCTCVEDAVYATRARLEVTQPSIPVRSRAPWIPIMRNYPDIYPDERR